MQVWLGRILLAPKAGLALVAAMFLSAAMGQQRMAAVSPSASLPVAPADPTHWDCVQMNQEFLLRLQTPSRQWEACWGQYPVRTAQCYVPKHRYKLTDSHTTAQIQCCAFEQEKARIYIEWDSQEAICRGRADARKRRERDALRQTQEERDAANRLHSARDSVARLEAAKDALQDPTQFLARLPRDSELRRMLFRETPKVQDPKLVDEVYGFLFDEIGGRVNQSVFANPIAQKIHGESLKQLRSIYDSLWGQYIASMNDVDKLVETMLKRPNMPTVPSTRPTAPAPSPNAALPPRNAVDCSVLRNIEASTRLRDSDPERWISLVQVCERK